MRVRGAAASAAALMVAVSAAGVRAAPAEPPAMVYAFLMEQYDGAVQAVLSGFHDPSAASPTGGTYSAVVAHLYASQLLPALEEMDVGLRAIAPAGSPGAAVRGLMAADGQLEAALRGLNAETMSESSYVARLAVLFRHQQSASLEAARLLGSVGSAMAIEAVAVPNVGRVSPHRVSHKGPIPIPAEGGYFATALAGARALTATAGLVAPSASCGARSGATGAQLGLFLSGDQSGPGEASIFLTVQCSHGAATYTTSPPLAGTEHIRAGDHLLLSVAAGAAASRVRLVDLTRRFTVSSPGPGIAVEGVLFGARPDVTLSVDAVVSPTTAGGAPPPPSSATLTPTMLGLPHVTASFSGCGIDGRAIGAGNAPLALRPSGSTGELAPSPLSAGGSFVLSYRAA